MIHQCHEICQALEVSRTVLTSSGMRYDTDSNFGVFLNLPDIQRSDSVSGNHRHCTAYLAGGEILRALIS